MKRITIFIIALLSAGILKAQYTMDDIIHDYIDEYKDMAMSEMETYRIPASITLAQAIYASKAGTNKVSKEANNHFGIMCHTNEWTGETYYETANQSKDYCFRKYASVKESYRDHSLFLAKRTRYAELFELTLIDYKGWARGLQELGYSGSKIYADTLISIIEKYRLMHYDKKVAVKLGDSTVVVPAAIPVAQENHITTAKTDEYVYSAKEPQKIAEKSVKQDTMEVNGIQVIVNKPVKTTVKYDTIIKQREPEKVAGVNFFTVDPNNVPFIQAYYPYTSRTVYENNKTKFIIAKAGDTYSKIAAATQLSEKNLRMYNEVYDGSEPIENEVVYLEMKGTKSDTEYHTLSDGDTYRYIAQKYGIQLKIIIKRNSGSLSTYTLGDRICIGCK